MLPGNTATKNPASRREQCQSHAECYLDAAGGHADTVGIHRN
ncbi:hypothetical protein [Mycobacterium sp. MS1601]